MKTNKKERKKEEAREKKGRKDGRKIKQSKNDIKSRSNYIVSGNKLKFKVNISIIPSIVVLAVRPFFVLAWDILNFL